MVVQRRIYYCVSSSPFLISLLLFGVGMGLGILLLTFVQAASCNQLVCPQGQTCVQEGGTGRCAQLFTIQYKGKPLAVPAESCLPTKPHFVDARGSIVLTKCQGRDGLVGTKDDCGCPFGNACQSDGSCAVVCNDGTLAGQCSREQPYACSVRGELVPDAGKCSCPVSAPLALPSGLCSPGLATSFRLARDFVGGNYTRTELGQRAFASLLFTPQTTGFQCASSLISGKHILSDGRADLSVTTTAGNYPQYRGTCTLESRALNPVVILDFGGRVTIDKLQIAFSLAPSILEYQLDYFDVTYNQWRPFYTGQVSSVLTPEMKGPRHWDFSGLPEYRQSDTGFITEYYYWPDVKNGDLFAQEGTYGGVKYTLYKQDIEFAPLTASKFRVRPTSWQQGAGIYEITAFNSSATALQLARRSGEQGIVEYASEGVYTSPALYLPSSTPSLTYGALRWETQSSSLFEEGRGAIQVPPRMVIHDTQSGVPWGNDIEYFGDPNTPNVSYRTPTTGSYPEAGFSSVRYDKTCMYDGKFVKDYTPATACLGHPAVLTTLWNPRWDEITNPEIYSMHLFYDYRGGQTFDRFILEEAVDRIARIRVKDLIGSTYTTVVDYRKTPTGKGNVTTVLQIPGGNHRALYVDMWIALHPGEAYWSGPRYTRDVAYRKSAYPLVWEAGFYQATPPVLRPARPVSDYGVRFQFRSASTKDALANASWYGANGVVNGSFTAPGQTIGEVHAGKPWYQYRVVMSTPDGRDSPLVTNISFVYSGVRQAPPVAVIEASPRQGVGATTFNFSAGNSYDADGQIVSYVWTFGDGTTGTGRDVSHRYEQPGTYFVQLTVTDTQGATSTSVVDATILTFDCLTPDASGSANGGLYAIEDEKTQALARQALVSYANARGMRVSDINTAEERFEAVLQFMNTHMSYLAHESCSALARGAGSDETLSVPELFDAGGACACPKGALFCGVCRDYSATFTTLARAVGIHSSCVYDAEMAFLRPLGRTDASFHAYNVIAYNGAYRVVEPQSGDLSAKFASGALSWTNADGVPHYLTGGVRNDKVSLGQPRILSVSGGDYSGASLASVRGLNPSVGEKIDNYQSVSGVPSTSTRCASIANVTHGQPFRTQIGGWDPVRLFADVCP